VSNLPLSKEQILQEIKNINQDKEKLLEIVVMAFILANLVSEQMN